MGTLRPAALRILLAFCGVLVGVGTAAAPALADDPVHGPIGPEIVCLHSLLLDVMPLQCQISGYQPGIPVVVRIEGFGTAATLRPDARGEAGLSVPWPDRTYHYHDVEAVQRDGDVTRRSVTSVSGAWTKRLIQFGLQSTGSDTTEEAPIAGLERPKSEVPLRVSAGIGLAVVGLLTLAVRRRAQARVGL